MEWEISELFVKPVDLVSYPDYLFVNPYPVDLGFILHRLATGFYRHQLSLRWDLVCLLENTERYNIPDSLIVKNAQMVFQLATFCLTSPFITIVG